MIKIKGHNVQQFYTQISEKLVSLYLVYNIIFDLIRRVTGGELFDDIVAREYYSEHDARLVTMVTVVTLVTINNVSFCFSYSYCNCNH